MFNGDELPEELRKKLSLPNGRFEPDTIRGFCTNALMYDLMPILIRARRSYYVKVSDISFVAGKERYRLPSRAYAGGFQSLQRIIDQQVSKLIQIECGRVDSITSGLPTSYYLEGGDILFYPKPQDALGFARLRYWLQPSKLVSVAECALIESVAGATITTSAIPAAWTTANRFDLVRGTSDYEPYSRDLTAINLTGTTIEFNQDVDTTWEVGDYVTLRAQSPYPYLYSAFFGALMQFAASYVHEALGDLAQKQASDMKAASLVQETLDIMLMRTQEPIPIESPL